MASASNHKTMRTNFFSFQAEQNLGLFRVLDLYQLPYDYNLNYDIYFIIN